MAHTPNDEQEKVIFHAARSMKDAAQREVYVEAACGGNPQLRARVDSLLSAAEDAGEFLESPPIDSQVTVGRSDVVDASGTTIGCYKLLEQIGEGGFGSVYMADQLKPIQRRVALKIIKPGMDTKQVIARFEAERQALALMDHPHIAKVLDAGATESGHPFFVMELVRGIPVTEYCDDRSLTTQERLNIFIEICSAIQHAHQKGIIHRDIKPRNILVSTNGDRPVPKVIDFGIAKATQGRLTDKTLFTQFRQFIGTPAYMSPEQAQMSAVDVDTRSDIYSLGILLYELLTGKTPLDSQELLKAGFDEVCRRIREEEAPTPSKRISSLQHEERKTLAEHRRVDPSHLPAIIRGDLDWIVMKAVEKDRTRRYATADALAKDIERHLHRKPVTAAPPNPAYLLRKFIRRNRALLTTVGIIAASLIVGTVVATTGMWRAIEAREDLGSQVLAKEAALKTANAARSEAQAAREAAESEKRRALHTAYLADMVAAHHALRLDNFGQAKRILDKNRIFDPESDPRNWEWRALWLTCQGDAERTFDLSNGGPVNSLSISRDGRWLAAGGGLAVRVWDLAKGTLHVTLTEYSIPELGRMLGRVAFAPSGNQLYAAHIDGTIRSWSVPDFARSDLEMIHGSEIIGMEVSPSGKWLVALGRVGQSAVELDVTVWELPTGNLRGRFEAGRARGEGSLAISADSSMLALGTFPVRIVDLQTLDEIQTFDESGGRGDVAISPDGEYVASAKGLVHPQIQLHRISNGELVAVLEGHTDGTKALAFSPDSRLLASASADQTVRLWDVETLRQVGKYRGHRNEVYCLAFSPDGKRLMSGDKRGQICVWNTQVGANPNWPISAQGAVRYGNWNRQHSQVSYSPDGSLLATTRAQRAQGQKLPQLGITLRASNNLALERVISDVGTAKRGVRFSPVDNLIAVGDENGTLALIHLDNPQEAEWIIVQKDSEVFPSRFTPDGKRLLVAARKQQEETVCVVISIEDRTTLARWSVSPGECSAIAPDGELVVTGHQDGLRFWSLQDTRRPTKFLPVFGATGVDFSPDGRWLAVSTVYGLINIVDIQTHQVVDELSGHLQHVGDVKFSPNGKRLASAGNKADALKVWDFDSGRELVAFEAVGHGFSNRQIEWSPDGNSILLMGGFGDLTIWRVPSFEEIQQREEQTSG